MLEIIRTFLGKSKNIKKDTYAWNSINAIMSAVQCPLILMVMTRTNGIHDAGIFSIAYAVAGLMIFVGQYGIRRFQVSDIHEKYSFAEYHGMRVLTCALMIICCLIYCIYGSVFNGYNGEKFAVIMMVCLLKGNQAYVDVIHGRMQQQGRLDIAAKSSAIRFTAEMLAYIAALIITKDLLISTSVCLAVSFIVMFVTSVNAASDFGGLHVSFGRGKLKGLVIEGFPLFVSLFLNMYISNAPKYAIDAYLTEEIQAMYNLIFMPAFMVGLLANFIFNPIITEYAKVWTDRKISRFQRLVGKQCVVIAGLTAAGLAVAATIGIPVLSLIFGVDLSAYKMELCVIMLGGGMMAYGIFFSTVITIIRMQNSLIISYGVVALAAKLLSGVLVTDYGMTGAAVLYAILMLILSVMLMIIMIWKIRKEKGTISAV